MSCSSPNKRLKSEAEDDADGNDDSCGICYAERGVYVAGEIDCCGHYFCFVCIMEWAKHESRCPICRQRFSNVRRPPMLGLFFRDVTVPCRDQVYHPYGNATTGPVDPNAEVKCSVCLVGTDENLLLVCDLCNTPSHTFCTGLGYTVPEGDWFCHDCAVSRVSVRTTIEGESVQQNVQCVSISDIVRGPSRSSHFVDRRASASSPSEQNQLSLPPVIPLPDRLSGMNGEIPVSRVAHAKRRVQILRANWNSLRSGSMQFQCNSAQSGGRASEKQDSSSVSGGGKSNVSSPSMVSGSGGLQQSAVQGGSSSNGRGSKDVEKAWKMMDRAKMKQKTHQRTSSIPKGVDKPSSRVAREISSTHFDRPELENQQLRKLDSRHTRMDKKYEYSSLSKNFENHRYPKLGEKRQSRVETIQHVEDRTNSEGYCQRPLPKMVHTGMQGVSCHDYEVRNVVNAPRRFASLVTSEVSTHSHCKFGSVISNKDVGIFNEEKRLTKTFGEGNTTNIEDVKTEIKSIVKMNLKLLTKDKKLGVEAFKTVARQATHTILAACTSKLQNSNIYPSSSICSHTQQFQNSSLMPNCCRQCFDVFVNNTVNSILLEKVGCA